MAAGPQTRRTVRALWTVGERYGHVPAPTPEVDPWEEDDALQPSGDRAVVVFDGVPSITVRLEADGHDTVTVEDVVDLEVPRTDTVAVVEAVLAGRARRRHDAGFLRMLSATLLRAPFAGELVVPVGEGRDRRTYTAPVTVVAPGASGWVLTLPTE